MHWALLLLAATVLPCHGQLSCAVDVVFVIDGSESIGDDAFNDQLKPVIISLADSVLMTPGSRVAAFEFSDGIFPIAGVSSDFVTDGQLFRDSVTAHVQSQGITFIASAIIDIAGGFLDEKADNIPVFFLLSDGATSNEDTPNIPAALDILNSRSLHRVFGGVGTPLEEGGGLDIEELEMFAGTDGAVVLTPDFLSLDGVREEIFTQISRACGMFG